ncbi:MAG: hypothetical protein JNN05_02350 [Candidatus Omnitrophica bacterium]|nr:hypothetical protein [Candidatus Omnitrophota bacterium]
MILRFRAFKTVAGDLVLSREEARETKEYLARGKRQKTKDKRQKTKDKRQKTKDIPPYIQSLVFGLWSLVLNGGI